jgi:cysteinyl-tRNA synthetase
MKHRYALALHTDDAHPHVHLVVKTVSEQGERLNIRKATLRNWRQQFATHLRDLGVAANATERAVRGQSRTSKTTAIYHAIQRKESTHERKQILELAKGSASALQRHRHGKEKLEETRSEVVSGWYAVAQQLQEERDYGLADAVRFFVAQMAPPATDQEQTVENVRNQRRAREMSPLERTR